MFRSSTARFRAQSRRGQNVNADGEGRSDEGPAARRRSSGLAAANALIAAAVIVTQSQGLLASGTGQAPPRETSRDDNAAERN